MRIFKIIAILLIAFIIIVLPVLAQSPTSTRSANLDDEVDKLKEKVAEKVEEMNGNKKKAVSGQIETNQGGTITIKNTDGDKITVDIDTALTLFYEISGTKIKEIEVEDLQKDDYIFVTGPEIGQTVNANAIYKDSQYSVISGKISEVNKQDFTVRVVTLDKSEYVFDVESSTKQKLLDIKTLEINSTGFSKLKEGDSIHVVFEIDATTKDESKFKANKILVIPNEYFLQ